ncbi:MAG TPA: FAD-dependent monooxygenase [Candidatus Binatia bacterium]|nr:FAD-dependent monooxygenase [Candidatus Binatia bacterium]
MTTAPDVIAVGGGLGGAALARALAVRGVRVLVLERERQFRGRVRGEWIAPWGAAEARADVVPPARAKPRLRGEADVPRLVAEFVAIGVPGHCYAGARAAGPLATFDCADTWVDHPYRDGLVLVGDAAASSDPTFGQGLSLTLRDVRVLRPTSRRRRLGRRRARVRRRARPSLRHDPCGERPAHRDVLRAGPGRRRPP